MARLLRTEYPFPTYNSKLGFDAYIKMSDEALDKIPEDRIFSWGVADGQALYYVVSFNPLVLQHIPYMDAYRLPEAHIRGLREADVRANIDGRMALNKIFGGSERVAY